MNISLGFWKAKMPCEWMDDMTQSTEVIKVIVLNYVYS